MKKFLLIISLVGNAALATILIVRQSGAPATVDTPAKVVAAAPLLAGPAPTEAAAAAMGLSVADATALRAMWPGMKTDDLIALVRRLRAEGFPPAMVRAIITALVNEQFRGRRKELYAAFNEGPYWKEPNYRDPKFRAAQRDLQNDYAKTLKDLLGPDGDPTLNNEFALDLQRRQFGNLAPEKVGKVQALLRDYNDLTQDVYNTAMGTGSGNRLILLPEDREKIAYLEKQKNDDLAKILTPEELEDYQLRTSSTASSLRNQLAGFNPTEEEFRTIFRLQNSVNDQLGVNFGPFGPNGPEQMQQYQAARKQLEAQVESTLSPDRAADYKLAMDPQTSMVSRLVARLELPSSVTTQVVAVQQDIQQRAAAVRTDQTLSAADRTAQLSALSQEATDKLTAALGSQRGVEAYKQYGGQWLQMLQVRRPVPPNR